MHTFSSITFDESLWPLLRVKYTGVPTLQQMQAYHETLTAHLERGERFVLLLDLSGMTDAGTSEHRLLQVAWLKQEEERLRELLLGFSFVITLPAVRLAVSVIFFLKPSPVPYLIANHITDAAAWAASRLEEKGLRTEAVRVRDSFQLPPTGNTPGQS